jgi:hypothetical protein
MRSLFFTLAALPLLALAAPGCATEVDADEADDILDESQDDLTGVVNSGYFIVTARDARRCVSPLCGGLFVKRVNAAKTRCADGSMQDACYVAEIDLGALGLPEAQAADFRASLESGQALIRAARMSSITFNGARLGKLTAREGWLAQGPARAGAANANALPSGTFYRMKDRGLRCFRAPCPTTSLAKLNSSTTLTASGVNLRPAGATAAQVSAGMDAYYTEEGLLIAGGVSGSAGSGTTANANQFYLRAVPKTGQSCGGRGQQACPSGQTCIWAVGDICGRADAPGTCQVKPTICPAVVTPVCGCDGKTYNNECEANARGVSVLSNGACVEPCYVGGCSGQICSDREGVISTCEFRPEYACYRSARCERQANGACGWTRTPELTSCLANPPR